MDTRLIRAALLLGAASGGCTTLLGWDTVHVVDPERCEPGAVRACYSGPAGTEGVGACKAGTQVCDADGSGHGECVGEVTPKPDECSAAMDASCDGVVEDECICFPLSTAPCYEGVAETLGVGECKGGQRTCAPDGLSYGVCSGQIIPTFEDCVSLEDEDCDGDLGVCTGTPVWSRRMGGSDFDTIIGLTVDLKDNVIVTGSFRGAASFGGMPLVSKGDGDIFIAKYSPTNGLLWNKQFGGVELDAGIAAMTDAEGNIFVTGRFRDTIDFGLGPFKSGGGDDIFLLKLDAQGNLIFAQQFGAAGDQYAFGLAVGADGGPIITGSFTGDLKFDVSAPTLTSVGSYDIFLAKLGPGGEHQWSRRFGDASMQTATSVAVGEDGRIVLAGMAAGQFNFGSIQVVTSNTDAFVAAFDSDGSEIYARVFGDALEQGAFGVAVDADGRALVTGNFQGKIMFDQALTASAMEGDIFVAALSPTGDPLWSRGLGGTGGHYARGVAVDPFGNVLLVGSSYGSLSFDTGALSSMTRDVLVAKFGPDGAGIWAKLIGDDVSSEQYGLEIAADSRGNVLVSGEFEGNMEFEGVPAITSVGGRDAFVAKLAP